TVLPHKLTVQGRMRRLERSGVKTMLGHGRPPASPVVKPGHELLSGAHVALNVLDALFVLPVDFVALLFEREGFLAPRLYFGALADRASVSRGELQLQG